MMRLIVLATAALIACSGGGTKKGTSGSNATSKKGMATQKGSENDGIVCDASTEGQGLCSDDTTIVFCSDGIWWSLDCASLGAVCDDMDDVVDCYEE